MKKLKPYNHLFNLNIREKHKSKERQSHFKKGLHNHRGIPTEGKNKHFIGKPLKMSSTMINLIKMKTSFHSLRNL